MASIPINGRKLEERERKRLIGIARVEAMVFGLFKKGTSGAAKPDQPVSSSSPATALAPTIPDETRLTQLGPVLWQNVRYGMTAAEVKAVRPEVRSSVKADKLHDGSTADLSIPHLKLGSHDYSVEFYFKGGTLTQVTIATNGGPTLGDFRDISNALRLRYGAEVEMDESPDSFSTAEWLSSDGINVNLVFHAGIDCLNVNFQHRYASAASQL
ncbi:hypothetical protein GRI97_04835 [Altererythrobacter xixiisoli]|uniref:Uncharacterized protein n=1 Tax=Croceibacterium xixiisoli TaxID=1476466 RepID=A0A6I4TUM4_9SPHN|nr:hypothetical protein [Croceibacterium xixiisoli]MXO98308.1 hypothetical protein [Croceibacterium xixiisoli]